MIDYYCLYITIAFNDPFITLYDKMIIYDKCVSIESISIMYRDVRVVRRVRYISHKAVLSFTLEHMYE